MKKALIGSIGRYSLHDGPGIRTTVFFKGCNMRCPWCHNPEFISDKPEIAFYTFRCIQCKESACPSALKMRSTLRIQPGF
ncbi:MAG: 4Fe-4S cluster-binding domain-containing protein [Deltaproteobacteria bacterium]|nr:4Fe-4S cluster-binding domain-containing protein [Deltaproteobacteria bacterium]